MAPTAALVQEKFETAWSGCRQPGNALAFGPTETLDAYLRQNVTGGLGSLVIRVRGTDDIAASYRAKFILDISMVQQ
jgi:hypothetical protein